MGIRKLPSGRWQARVMVEGVRRSETFEDEADARRWETLIEASAIRGTLPSTATFASYAHRWLSTYESSPKNTYNFYRNHLVPHLLPRLGTHRIADIRPTDVTRVLQSIREEISAATADACYRTLSALMRSAEQDDVIARSPVRSKRHRPKRQPSEQLVLERATARRVLLQLGGWYRDTAMLQLALGARVGEIAGLTPTDVTATHVVIRRRVSSRTVRATKNHRLRRLEIPTVIRPTLSRLLAERAGITPIPDLGDEEWPSAPWDGRWLVQTSTGRSVALSAYNKKLKAACAEVGAPILSSHGLRHTYVSWMVDDGHSAEKIAFWIGDTPETVRRVYAHMLEDSSAPAAATIDAALGDLG